MVFFIEVCNVIYQSDLSLFYSHNYNNIWPQFCESFVNEWTAAGIQVDYTYNGLGSWHYM